MATALTSYSPAQLRQILALKAQIEALQNELAALVATPILPAQLRSAQPGYPPGLPSEQTPNAELTPAKRRAGRKSRLPANSEDSLFGLCNGAYLPRPIKRARRKTAPAVATSL